ncbi:MAG TPA: protein kinase [Polyangia bacterium]|jgi:serine/threonine-protein kinase
MSLQARYTILRKIADGGTAEIFLATQNGVHGFEKVVVLKRIFPAYYADPQFRDMLVNEAHIAMSFNHSNIVQVLDLGEDDGQYILALELVDGWTLDAVMRRVRAVRSSIQPALALYVTAEVCRALAYAHAKTGADGAPLGIVHRDISPHNVLLSEQGEVKLTDFGIATARNQVDQGTEKVIKGKIAYMSPEQAAGATIDARSDLFSVGTMLYVMVCGRYPFDAPTDLEVLLMVKNGEAVPPEVARPGIHPELSRLLKRAMAKDPAERYQRADDMLVEVEQVMRAAFRAVGQTELKRWLQDLSTRDGVPTLTKTPALPSSLSAGRVVGASASSQTTPAKIPPPPSPARSGSTPIRPAPPPAALSVGRKTAALSAAGAPTRPPRIPTPPLPPAGAPETPAGEPAAPEAASARTPSGPLSGATTLPPAKPADAGVSTRISRPSSPGLPALTTPAASRATPASGLPPLGPHTPLPSPSPRATIGSRPAPTIGGTGERPGIPIPIPPTVSSAASLIPPPPVSPEILATLAASESRSTVIAAERVVSGETSEASGSAARSGWGGAPKRRLALVGAGLGGLLLIAVSLKTCGAKKPVVQLQSQSPATSVAVVQPAADAGGAPPPKAAAVNVATAPDAAATPTVAAGEQTGNGGAGGAAPTAEATATRGATGALAPAAGETAKEAATAPDARGVGDKPAATADGSSVATETAPPPSPVPEAGAEVAPTPVAAEAPSVEPPHGDGAAEGDANDASSENKNVKVNVTVQSTPTGARVTTAHHNYGTTPTVIHLRSGNVYALTFTHDGFRPFTRRVEVTTDPEQQIDVTLRKAAAPAPVKAAPEPAPAPPPPPPPPPKPDKSWWQKMFKR